MRYHDQLATCLRVADRDTIDIDIPDGKPGALSRVRLRGVDTPEIEASGKGEMHFGPEASAFTKQALEGRQVRIELGPIPARVFPGLARLGLVTLQLHDWVVATHNIDFRILGS